MLLNACFFFFQGVVERYALDLEGDALDLEGDAVEPKNKGTVSYLPRDLLLRLLNADYMPPVSPPFFRRRRAYANLEGGHALRNKKKNARRHLSAERPTHVY